MCKCLKGGQIKRFWRLAQEWKIKPVDCEGVIDEGVKQSSELLNSVIIPKHRLWSRIR